MIAYKIQLRCVIQDKIQSETKSQFFFIKTKFLLEDNCRKKFLAFLSQNEFCLLPNYVPKC